MMKATCRFKDGSTRDIELSVALGEVPPPRLTIPDHNPECVASYVGPNDIIAVRNEYGQLVPVVNGKPVPRFVTRRLVYVGCRGNVAMYFEEVSE